ncbi:hypothetical protein JCM6882_003482 [Rhodosporidiobolus microsporus]
MPPTLPSLTRVFEKAHRAGTASTISFGDVRRLLREVEGWRCSSEEWREGGLKEEAKKEWNKLLEQHDSLEATASSGIEDAPRKKRKKSVEAGSSHLEDEDEGEKAAAKSKNKGKGKAVAKEKAKEKKGKSKYERAAERNVKTLMTGLGGLGGAFVGAISSGNGGAGGPLDDDDDSDVELVEYASASASGSPVASTSSSKASKPRPKITVQKRTITVPSSSPEVERRETIVLPSSSSPEVEIKQPKSEVAAANKKKDRKKKPAAPRAAPSSSPKPKASKAKGKGKEKEGAYKSAEFIGESDDSSNELAASVAPAKKRRRSSASGSGSGGGDGTEGGEEDDDEGSGSGSGGGKKGKGTGRGREKVLKEGEQPKGTAEEEKRIAELKALLQAAAPSRRAFTATTGAERTLTVARRTEVLETLLEEVGLPLGKGGKLPSLKKAREVGEKREMEREMESLSANPTFSGLRDGKAVRPVEVAGSAAANRFEARKQQVLEGRKSFGAFLGDQSSDSD